MQKQSLILSKKIYAVVILLMLLAIVGCGNNDRAQNDDISDTDSYTATGEIDWDFFNERAEIFITQTASGDYDIAANMFDETMTEVFGAEGLQEAWEFIIGQAGEFIDIHEIENAETEGFFICGVIMRHETIGFAWNIVFSEDGYIAGIHTGGTIQLPDDLNGGQLALSTPIQREGFTDYPIVIGEGTDFPLNGILSIPDDRDGAIPAVVIVHGSGPVDMDGNVFGNKPYRDIAEFLAAQGIAVIRHDKRTLAHVSSMAQLGGELTVREESIEDAILAANMLRVDSRIDADNIFIIGHSLGGVLAPRIHANGGNFNGLILMAATPRCLLEVTLDQNNASIFSAYEGGFINAEQKAAMLEEQEALTELFGTVAGMTDEEARLTPIPFWGWAYYIKDLMAHPFADYAENVTVPVLVIQGESDFQVLADVDFILMQEIFAGHDNVTFKLYENLNHLFMSTTANNFVQHANEIIESTGNVDDQVLRDIVTWIMNSSL